MRMTLAALALLLLAACGPRDETPGVRLGGDRAEVPADFSFSSEHEEIWLEARGMLLPRVVTIWCVAAGEKLYVWGDPDSGWVRRVAQRPGEVRVRMGDDVYELRAEEVTEAGEREWVAAAYSEKYGEDLDAIFERPATVDDFELLYRLTRR